MTSPDTKGYEYASDSQMEIEFTNIFTKLGYKIKTYSDGKNIYDFNLEKPFNNV